MKLAIIGASTGQKALYMKAKEMGYTTLSFAWPQGAVCKDLSDKYYPISIFEMDRIVDVCGDEYIEGVVSNGSDLTAKVAAYISEMLHLNGNSYQTIINIQDKLRVREQSVCIDGLSQLWYYRYDGHQPPIYPCVCKPAVGGGKFGVSYVESKDSFHEAIAYANKIDDVHVVIEEYIKGYEVSVETISYHGKHYIIQITDKVSSGPPHFVELAHHQPSSLPQSSINKIHMVVPKLLSQIGYMNGAAHIEMKITEDGKLYLIEVNARGGGDHISDSLVQLSTGYDYIKAMIDVATNSFCEPKVQSIANSGIFFLCQQTSFLLPIFMDADSQPWLVEKNIGSFELVHSVDNYSRNGYIIYKSDHRIQPAIIDNHA